MARPGPRPKIQPKIPWFNLDKYDGADGFDDIRWYEQLAVRAALVERRRQREWELGHAINAKSRAITVANAVAEYDNETRMIEEKLRQTPIADTLNDETFGNMAPVISMLREGRPDMFSRFAGVRPTTIDEFGRTKRYVEAHWNPQRDWWGGTGWEEWHCHCVDMYSDEFQNSGRANVSVELTLPDEILIEHFAKMLKTMRETTPAMQRIDTTYWAEWGVLPCIDLGLLGGDSARSMTRERKAGLLEVDKDTLRRSVEPLAERIMTKAFLGAFEAQLIKDAK